MADIPTPRQMVKGLLQGIRPVRPLFLPILFSLGAQIENVPMQAFLNNPTKISNSLRRIRAQVQSDGVACYFDPTIELEALGATLQWTADGKLPSISWAGISQKRQIPEEMRPVELAAKSGRIAVAVEVIRRLNTLLRDDSLLMAGVTGPFTLAARMMQMESGEVHHFENFSMAALEAAAALITQISSAYVSAGANLIFIQEELLPVLTREDCDAWAAMLSPAINVIRFYEALPVLRLPGSDSCPASEEAIFGRDWDCAICVGLQAVLSPTSRGIVALGTTPTGIALPQELFQTGGQAGQQPYSALSDVLSEMRPSIVTTAGDLPAGSAWKQVLQLLENVPRGV